MDVRPGHEICDSVSVNITAPVDAVAKRIACLFTEDGHVGFTHRFHTPLPEVATRKECRLAAVIAAIITSICTDQQVVDAVAVTVHTATDRVANPVTSAAFVGVVRVAVRVILQLSELSLERIGSVGC